MKLKFILPLLVLAQYLGAQVSEGTMQKLQRHELQIKELSQQVQYYKKALNAAKAIRSATFENIQFDITQVTGSRKDGSVFINFTYTNTDKIRKMLQCERAVMVDLQGQQYQTTNVFLAPSSKVVVNDVLTNVPYKGAAIYRKINYFPTIRALVLYVYPKDHFSNPVPVVFENVPIIWE